MKKSFLLMGALVVGAAFVSCVDDDESSEVKELRQIQLNKERKNLDNEYWTMYNNAVDKVKSYQTALKTAQENLDDAKDQKTTLTDVKEAYIAYQQQVIARNEKDIADKEAEITVQKAMAGKTYEEISKAKIEAANAKEKANKEAADYWIDLIGKGYDKDYDGNSVDLSGANVTTNKINMLLAANTEGVKYKNNKLDELPFVKAMNAIYSNTKIYYEFEGEQQNTNVYSFKNSDGDTYSATDMFKSKVYVLEDENGKQITTYTVYEFNNGKLKKAASDQLSYTSALANFINNDLSDDSDKAKYKALQSKINELVEILSADANYTAYTNLINEYVGHVKKIYALDADAAKASSLASAYAAYISKGTVTDNEAAIATMQDAIKTYNENIKTAKAQINETINNGITDKETAINYYTTQIAELKSQIAANEEIAAKYRALIVGSESSNNQQQQPSTPASEETPAE